MNSHDRQIFIWISAVPGIGPQTLKLVDILVKEQKVALEDFLHPSENMCKSTGLTPKQLDSLKSFQKKFSPKNYSEILAEKEISTVCFGEKNYPTLLKEIPTYPHVLYYKGSSDFWNTLPISVVGTRHLTSYGEQVTKVISGELLDLGATIISGFMYGADLQAHLTALQKHGKTVGVLGYGFDFLDAQSREYPVQEMLESGNTFVTEFAPFVPAYKGNFPTRNRIVAGISHATVVTEAAQKSGSLITANYAAEFGRLVCAVPGAFTSLYSEGTKNLVNQGAKLVTSGLEIISEVAPSLENLEGGVAQFLEDKDKKIAFISQLSNETDRSIMLSLHAESASTEVIANELNLEISDALSHLSILEVQGLIHRVGEKWWSYF